MKVFNNTQKASLHLELQDYLVKFRQLRNFNPQNYLDLKSQLLNNYLLKNNLKAIVVALSGGIDSAVVLGIVQYAQKQSNSPIKKIIPVTLPVHETKGAVNQSQSQQRALNLCQKWGLELTTIELKDSFKTLSYSIEEQLKIKGNDWAQGQLVSYLRTPTLYYINSLMAEQNLSCVIAGTTNKSEGSYLGYVGKASDGMVDLQLISDLYKSEVYELGRLLEVSEEIMNIPPTGDIFDGRNDEDLFGASYDFVELYLETLSGREIFLKSKEAKSQFEQYKNSLDKLHEYNAHKYLVGSPAIHLDLIVNKIPPFWGQIQSKEQIDYNKIVNLQDLKITIEHNHKTLVKNKNNVLVIENLLSQNEVKNLMSEIQNKSWVKAGKSGYTKDNSEDGSLRLSNLNDYLSKILTQRIQNLVPQHVIEENKIYRFVEMAKLFRYIKYPKQGRLYPHRDFSFTFNSKKKTFKSVVIYLTEGKTTFLKEKEGGDWSRPSNLEERSFEIILNSGSALIFDHNLLHESLVHKKEKIIIRTDLVYEEC
jgi:NAD+ synthetase